MNRVVMHYILNICSANYEFHTSELLLFLCFVVLCSNQERHLRRIFTCAGESIVMDLQTFLTTPALSKQHGRNPKL